ncbi:MAG: CHASE3 domain-containing protein, partial [Ferruginibacter sp.]
MKSTSSNKPLYIALLIFMGLIVAVLVITYNSNQTFKAFDASVEHTHAVLDETKAIYNVVTEMQAADLVSIITANSRYFEPANDKKLLADNHIHALRDLTKDNAARQPMIDSLEFFINRRILFSQELFNASRENNISKAKELYGSGKSKIDVDSVKSLLRQIETAENGLLKQRNASKDRMVTYFDKAFFALIIAILIFLVIGVLFITLNARLENKIKVSTSELAFEHNEKEKRAAELAIANKELLFQNDEKGNRAAELVIANTELAFENSEKESRAAELVVANKELLFQNDEKENRAAELVIANTELAFENSEKENRAAELAIANKELLFQNNEKENRAAELILTNEELLLQNKKNEKLTGELIFTNKKLNVSQEKLIHINRLYGIISHVNKSISHTKDEQTLFNKVCKIAVEQGKFKMAWVGVPVNTRRTIKLIASAGETGHDMQRFADYSYEINGPIDKILNGQDCFVVNEIQQDPNMVWKEHAAERGFNAVVCLAIKKAGLLKAILTIYSSEINFFDAEEITLLKEIAGDISFAMDVFENEQLKLAAQQALHESESNLQAIFENTSEGFILTDTNGVIKSFNDKAKAIFLLNSGKEMEVGKEIFDYVDESRRDIYKNAAPEVLEGRELHFELSFERENGETAWYVFAINRVDSRGKVEGFSIAAKDITEKIFFEHKIIRAIIKTQEDERYEIGGELHDNVCQLLATSQLSLGMLKKALPPSSMQWYDQSKEYIILAAKEISNLSHRLAPAFFDDTTLKESFEILLKAFNTEDKYTVKLFFDDAVKNYNLPQDVQLNLYRILQEQLRNIYKHANARMIELDVTIFNKMLKMQLFDDGVGFDVNKVQEGIGLANIKRRAELFSGRFQINSTPGKGCKVVVEIPLKEITGAKIADEAI